MAETIEFDKVHFYIQKNKVSGFCGFQTVVILIVFNRQVIENRGRLKL